MIILFYGQDTYRSWRKLKEIVNRYKEKHKSGLNLVFFEGEKLSFNDLRDAFFSSAMFEEKKLIILKNIFSNKNLKEELLKEKKKLFDEKKVILIYENKEISEKDELFKFLKKNSTFQEFKPLEGERLKNWIKKELLNYKSKIEPLALEMLVEFVGNDLWRMENEIKKLVCYKKNQIITREDVKLMVKPKFDLNIFKTIDAIAEKRKELALNLIHHHLSKGEDPLYLLAMINFQIRNLLITKSSNSNFFNKKLHPFIVKKINQQAKSFSLEGLKKIYQKIFQTDLKIKTGKLGPEIALDLLIAEI